MVQFDTDGTPDGFTEQQEACRTVIERSTDRPDRCTIYDADPAGEMSPTRWVSATEGSFVFSELMR